MILLFLGHNFWTRNARKLMKGSKDSDSSLVSNENLSEILASSSWALGQVTWAKIAKNLAHLWHHSKKTHFFFFISGCNTFDSLNSSWA